MKATDNSNNKIRSVSALSACKVSHKSSDIISKVNHNIGELKSSSCEDLSGTDEKCLSPAGRLEMAYEKWQEVTADLYILEVIRMGYKLSLMASPQDICFKNNRSARENMPFVKQDLESLIKKKVSCHRWRKFQKLLTR